MVIVLEKYKNTTKHEIQFSKLNDSSIKFTELDNFLKKEKDPRFSFHQITINSNEFINKTINFSSSSNLEILNLIYSKSNFKLLKSDYDEITDRDLILKNIEILLN